MLEDLLQSPHILLFAFDKAQKLQSLSPAAEDFLGRSAANIMGVQADFARINVARISLGSGLARAAHKALIEAAGPILGEGDFSPMIDNISGSEVDKLLAQINRDS